MADWDLRANEIYLEACSRADVTLRDKFVCEACNGDELLYKKVNSMLSADEQADDFLSAPATAHYEATLERMIAKVGSRIGSYKLLEELGEGGFGIVYMAEQKEPVRRKVALKIIKPGMDTREVIARFEAERQAVAMMDHPNIAKVYEAGATDEGRPYFVMELVNGVSITNFCDENKLSNHQRLGLFISVCQAIQHAHQKGVVHRDLKPSNVMVTIHDGEPMVKVIDFGIAKAVNRELTDKTLFTRYGQMIGTPQYMSPEQAAIRASDIDSRSDVYSLGVLLYELLTGSPPLDAERLRDSAFAEIQRIICEEEPPKPSTRLSSLGKKLSGLAQNRKTDASKLARNVAGDLDWIVMKCLEKDRNRRYDAASGLATEIQRYLSNEPIEARPPSTAYRVSKLWQKHQTALSVAMVIGMSLILATALSLWFGKRALMAESDARVAQQKAEQQRDIAAKASERATAARDSERTQKERADEQRLLAEQRLRESQAHLYSADIRIAHQATQDGNLGAARRILSGLAKSAPDVLGFEWGLLRQQTLGDQLLTSEELPETTNSITVLGDDMVAVATNLNDVFVCSTKDASVLRKLKNGSVENFSTNMHRLVHVKSQQRIVYFGQESVSAWDTRTWEQTALAEHPSLLGPHWAACLSPDGKLVAAGHDDSVTLWRTADMSFVGEIPSRPFSFGRTVAFLPSGNAIAIGDRNPNRLEVWDFEQKPAFSAKLRWQRRDFDPSAILAHENTLLVASTQGELAVFHAETKEKLQSVPKSHSVFIFDLAFSPSKSTFYSAGGDHLIKEWHLPTLEPVRMLRGHGNEVWSMRCLADGRIVSGGKDWTIRLWDATTQPTRRETLAGMVREGIFSPDGRLVVGQHETKGTTIWSMETFQPTQQFKGEEAAHAFTDKGVLTTAWDQVGHLRVSTNDPQTGEKLTTVHLHDIQSDSYKPKVVSSSDGRSLLLRTSKALEVWDYAARNRVATFANAGPRVLYVSPDGSRVVTDSSLRREVQIWTIGESNPKRIDNGNSQSIQAACIAPDGTTLAVSSSDGFVSLWNVSTGQLQGKLFGAKQATGSIAYSPDGRTLVSASGRKVRLWHVATRRELMSFDYDFEVDRSYPISFSPDGQFMTVATGHGDTEVFIALHRDRDLP